MRNKFQVKIGGQIWRFGLMVMLIGQSFPGVVSAQIAPSSDSTTTLATADYQVPDCPGITRKINALHLPPSIYTKPCSSSTGGATGGIEVGATGLGKPTGQYGTGTAAPAAGSLFWIMTGGQTYPISQGYGLTDFATNSDYGTGAYGYCDAYGQPGHCGVDVATPMGTKTYTPVSGRVICAGTGVSNGEDPCTAFNYSLGANDGTSGRFQIKLSDGSMLIMGHMQHIEVTANQQLKAGDYIGLSGGENGPHIHVEFRQADPGIASGFHTYDPREVFGVSAGVATPPQTTTDAAVTTPATVQTTSAPAASMVQLEQKYGFNAPSGKSDKDFAKYAQNFTKERDLAAKFAPQFGIDPEMVVWWTWFESLPPYDSYHYNNCTDSSHEVDLNCATPYNGGWQIGYGQQFEPMTQAGVLKAAFTATHGDATNVSAVQSVGQQVLDQSGIKKTFPSLTIEAIEAGLSSNSATAMNYWAYTLGRDPDMSVYFVAKEIKGDLDAHPEELYRDITAGWGSYYQTHWQEASNVMNDIVSNWGTPTVGGVLTSSNCPVTASLGTASCSGIPDTFNSGTSLAVAVARMNTNMSAYKQIAACADVPWQAVAAINHMEADFLQALADHNPWQIDTGTAPTSDLSNFVEAGCVAMKILQDKAKEGVAHTALTQNMDPTDPNTAAQLKDAFWGYNGRAEFVENQPGCSGGADCSPYVMGQWDRDHLNMSYSGTIYGVETGEIVQNYDGTWKLYYELYFSTFDASGNILVLGGKCNQANGVTNGISLPTAQQIAITSQFFAPDHIGIDIANLEGQPVFAMVEGDIAAAGWTDVGGYYVLEHFAGNADNPKQRWIYYGHLSPAGLLAQGSHVTAGQQIGTTGPHMVLNPQGKVVTNGDQDAPHLHFDIRTQASESRDASGHVNPCSIDLFKTGYPTLTCSAYPGKGVSWD